MLLARRSLAVPRLGPWLALVGWGALSLAWSPAPQRGLGQLACWALILPWCALLRAIFAADPRWRTRYVVAGLVAGLLCAGLALAQRAGLGPRLGHHLVTGTLGNPNVVACTLLLLLPASRWLIRTRRGGLRWLGWGAALALSAAIVATRCQGAALGLLVVWGYWIATCAWPRRRRLALLVALVLAGAILWAHPGWRRAFSAGLAGRLHIARVTTGVVGEHPLRGTGLGGFPSAAATVQGELLRDHRGPSLWTNLRDAHNQPLMLLAELGPLGLAALLWLVIPPLVSCHRRRQEEPLAAEAAAAWLGLAVCGLTETPLPSPPVLLLACGWLALGGGLEAAKSSVRPRAALLALAALGLVQAAGALWADLQLGRGLNAVSAIDARTPAATQRRQLDAAVRAYGRGLSPLADPAELLLQRALARRELGRHAAAARDMRRSFALLPSPERALFLGDLATAHEDLDEALTWYRRAIALHPRYARAYNNLGVALLRRGDARAARRYLRRALSLRPYDPAIRANWRLVRRGPAS